MTGPSHTDPLKSRSVSYSKRKAPRLCGLGKVLDVSHKNKDRTADSFSGRRSTVLCTVGGHSSSESSYTDPAILPSASPRPMPISQPLHRTPDPPPAIYLRHS